MSHSNQPKLIKFFETDATSSRYHQSIKPAFFFTQYIPCLFGSLASNIETTYLILQKYSLVLFRTVH